MGQPAQRNPVEAITRAVNPVRGAFHTFLSLLGWAGFGLFVLRVFLRPIHGLAWPTLFVLLGVAAAVTLVHLLWIHFNLRLYRTRARRTRVPEAGVIAPRDVVGRELSPVSWEQVRSASYVRIELSDGGGSKRYEARGTEELAARPRPDRRGPRAR